MGSELNGVNLRKRAKLLRLPLNRVAAEAGLNKHTLSELGKTRSRGAVSSTLTRVLRVIEEHERAELARLAALHPDFFHKRENAA